MGTHADRMHSLGRIALPSLTPERMRDLSARLSSQLPPGTDRLIRKKWKRASAAFRATMENGAGLPMDRELRMSLFEFNDRAVKHGLRSLPASFNVLEAFVDYDTLFSLKPERDHVFSYSDFVDFVTSTDAPSDLRQAAQLLKDGVIHSFNSSDDPHDVTFSTETNEEYGFGGISIVRHGDEASILMVAGKLCDLERATAEFQAPLEGMAAAPGKAAVLPAPELRREAVPLNNTNDMQRILVLTRLDLRTMSAQVRYILTDCGDVYTITTDDPVCFEDRPATADETLASLSDALDRKRVLFDLCSTSLLLPSYFAFKITLVREEERLTPNGERLRNLPPSPPDNEKLSPQERVIFRRVSALRVIHSGSPRAVRRFAAPRFQVEVSGFWRRLKPGASGHTPSGDRVVGKTWVSAHLKWKDRPPKPIEVLVKSRVAIARAIAVTEQLIQNMPATGAEKEPEPSPGASTRAEVYEERRRLTARVRWKILERDNFRCRICGADGAADRDIRLEVDHIIPVTRGGKTTPDNLRTLCNRCNNGRGAPLP